MFTVGLSILSPYRILCIRPIPHILYNTEWGPTGWLGGYPIFCTRQAAQEITICIAYSPRGVKSGSSELGKAGYI